MVLRDILNDNVFMSNHKRQQKRHILAVWLMESSRNLPICPVSPATETCSASKTNANGCTNAINMNKADSGSGVFTQHHRQHRFDEGFVSVR